MKKFSINLIITTVSIFVVVCFVRMDMNINSWGHVGRAMFILITLFVTWLVTVVQDNSNN